MTGGGGVSGTASSFADIQTANRNDLPTAHQRLTSIQPCVPVSFSRYVYTQWVRCAEIKQAWDAAAPFSQHLVVCLVSPRD